MLATVRLVCSFLYEPNSRITDTIKSRIGSTMSVPLKLDRQHDCPMLAEITLPS